MAHWGFFILFFLFSGSVVKSDNLIGTPFTSKELRSMIHWMNDLRMEKFEQDRHYHQEMTDFIDDKSSMRHPFLIRSKQLDSAAQEYAKEWANIIRDGLDSSIKPHFGLNHSTPRTRMYLNNFKGGIHYAENEVVIMERNLKRAFKKLLSSASHRKNMLGDFTHIGLGSAVILCGEIPSDSQGKYRKICNNIGNDQILYLIIQDFAKKKPSSGNFKDKDMPTSTAPSDDNPTSSDTSPSETLSFLPSEPVQESSQNGNNTSTADGGAPSEDQSSPDATPKDATSSPSSLSPTLSSPSKGTNMTIPNKLVNQSRRKGVRKRRNFSSTLSKVSPSLPIPQLLDNESILSSSTSPFSSQPQFPFFPSPFYFPSVPFSPMYPPSPYTADPSGSASEASDTPDTSSAPAPSTSSSPSNTTSTEPSTSTMSSADTGGTDSANKDATNPSQNQSQVTKKDHKTHQVRLQDLLDE